MSDYESEFGEPEPEEGDLIEPDVDLGGEVDPAVVAFLDQEEKAFQEERQLFQEMYGFDHDCHCAADYSGGKVVTVTECFMELSSDALDRAAEATYEARTLATMLQEMLDLNKGLVKLVESLGGKDDLEAFFRAQMELEQESGSEDEEAIARMDDEGPAQLDLGIDTEPEENDDDEGSV